MGRSDSRPYTLGRLWIPLLRFSFSETLSLRNVRRASQVPRLIFRHAPSPTTPDSPTGSCARSSPAGGRLHHLRKVGHCRISVTRPKRVRLRWARVFVVQGADLPFALSFHRAGLTPHVRLPSRDRPRRHVERAIHMSDSFQSDRSARLSLAYLRRRGRREAGGGTSGRLVYQVCFSGPSPLCPRRSEADVWRSRPANCLSAASFCRSAKRLRSAGHPPQAGGGIGARFFAYFLAAQQESRSACGAETPRF